MDGTKQPERSGRTIKLAFGDASALQSKVGTGFSTPKQGVRSGSGNGNNRLRQGDKLDDSFMQWQKDKSQDNLKNVLNASKGIIDQAITSYAQGSAPSVRSHAKVLVRKAMDTYDPSKARLSTHLYNNLRPLMREAQTYNTLYTPERVAQDISYLHTWESKFKEEKGFDPNDDELADFSKLSKKRIHHIRKYDRNQVFEGKLRHLADTSGDDAGEGTEALQIKQSADMWEDYVYDSLNSRDKLIYELKLGKNGKVPRSVSEIALKLKMSPSAISQRLAKISERISEGANLDA